MWSVDHIFQDGLENRNTVSYIVCMYLHTYMISSSNVLNSCVLHYSMSDGINTECHSIYYNLVQTSWDTCSNNHHYVHNEDVWQYLCSKGRTILFSGGSWKLGLGEVFFLPPSAAKFFFFAAFCGEVFFFLLIRRVKFFFFLVAPVDEVFFLQK